MTYFKIIRHFICAICISLSFNAVIAQEYENMSFPELIEQVNTTEKHLNSIGRADAILITETLIDVSEKFNKQQKFYLKASLYNLLGKIYFTSKDYKIALQKLKTEN